jgi:guanidinoacetate N-methyltransferase
LKDPNGRQFGELPADWRTETLKLNDASLDMGDHQVMQAWEDPLMKALATVATRKKGAVLELGFGMGISASHIISIGCSSYTVIEANAQIAENARQWARAQDCPVTVIEGFWQDQVSTIGKFDGILFDTYPTNEIELSLPQHVFVEPFMDVVPNLLAAGGVFTYYSNETMKIRPDHIALMLERFHTVELTVAERLAPPANCNYWQHDHMVVPALSGPRAR